VVHRVVHRAVHMVARMVALGAHKAALLEGHKAEHKEELQGLAS